LDVDVVRKIDAEPEKQPEPEQQHEPEQQRKKISLTRFNNTIKIQLGLLLTVNAIT
jgi:hypothetical protein